MSNEYTCPPKLKLIVEHLNAVRTLVQYVNGVALKKDMQDLSNYLQQDLSSSILHPAGWEDLYPAEGSLCSSPRSKWRVVRGDVIAIEICPAWPVQEDYEPYVNLYVPPNWKKRSQFIAKLKAPPGFEHVSQYSEGELSEDTSVFKYLPYTSYVVGGLFDSTGFIDAFREATKALVAMEKVIDGILERLD
jgi:hypothetical protein